MVKGTTWRWKGTKQRQKIRECVKSQARIKIFIPNSSLFHGTRDNSDMFTSYVSRSKYCTFVRHFVLFFTVIPLFKPHFLLLPTLLSEIFSTIFDNSHHWNWIKILIELNNRAVALLLLFLEQCLLHEIRCTFSITIKGFTLVQLIGAGWVQTGVGGIFLKIPPHSCV